MKLKVLVLYEDLIAGEDGRELANSFLGDGGRSSVEIVAWNVAMLDEDYLARHISEQAVEADLIVVSLHEATGLTARLKHWMHGWALHSPARSGALVICMAEANGRRTLRAAAFARRLAREAGLDFFRQPAANEGDEAAELTGETHWIM